MPRSPHDELTAFDRDRLALLDRVGAVTSERLTARPEESGWTLLEVIEHIVLAEHDIFQGLPDPATMQAVSRGLKNRVMFPLVLLVLRRGITVEVPSPSMKPLGATALHDLRAQWDESQHWLARYTGGRGAESPGDAVFGHPVTGPLPLGPAMRLRRVHLESHYRDVDKLMRLTEAAATA